MGKHRLAIAWICLFQRLLLITSLGWLSSNWAIRYLMGDKYAPYRRWVHRHHKGLCIWCEVHLGILRNTHSKTGYFFASLLSLHEGLLEVLTFSWFKGKLFPRLRNRWR